MAKRNTNPYQAPGIEKKQLDELEKIFHTDKLVWRAIATSAMSAVFFGVAGAVIGWFIGMLIPDFYRNMFDAVDRVDFSPTRIGLGLGLTQGLVAGAVIGCVAVISAAIYKSRMRTAITQQIRGSGDEE